MAVLILSLLFLECFWAFRLLARAIFITIFAFSKSDIFLTLLAEDVFTVHHVGSRDLAFDGSELVLVEAEAGPLDGAACLTL